MFYYGDRLATEYVCLLHDLLSVNEKVTKQLIEDIDILIGQCAVLPVLAACYC